MTSRFFLIGVIATLGLTAPIPEAMGAETKRDSAEPSAARPKEVRLKGHVVCLTEALGKAYEVEIPTDHEHLYGFKTTDGHYYTLLRNRFSEPLFVEKSLRQKKLALTGKVLPKSDVLTVQKIQSIHHGKLHDVYYYCDVCAIEAVEPGPCMCCQQPVELVEEALHPVGQKE